MQKHIVIKYLFWENLKQENCWNCRLKNALDGIKFLETKSASHFTENWVPCHITEHLKLGISFWNQKRLCKVNETGAISSPLCNLSRKATLFYERARLTLIKKSTKHYRDKNNHIKMLRKFQPALKKYLTLFLKNQFQILSYIHRNLRDVLKWNFKKTLATTALKSTNN